MTLSSLRHENRRHVGGPKTFPLLDQHLPGRQGMVFDLPDKWLPAPSVHLALAGIFHRGIKWLHDSFLSRASKLITEWHLDPPQAASTEADPFLWAPVQNKKASIPKWDERFGPRCHPA